MNSCVYTGTVAHRRAHPRHAFRAPLRLLFLDLDEISEICATTRGWAENRFAPTEIRRSDYLGDPRIPLPEAVRSRVLDHTGVRPEGPIRLLTQPRCFGVVFNPVSFYYCYDAAGAEVEWILAEVTNIPWGERHSYVVPFGGGEAALPKLFYVSPYLPMDLDYTWTYARPGAALDFSMRCSKNDETAFEAKLSLRRQPLQGATWAGVWPRSPWSGVSTVVRIYWHAFRLRRKGARAFPHTATVDGGDPRP